MSANSANTTEDLVNGIAACRAGNWRKGHELLTRVAQEEDSDSPYPGYFYSYYGVAMARCEGRKRDGAALCRYGVELAPRDPETRLNLARVYLICHNRKLAVKQIKLGLCLRPNDSKLLALHDKIGRRRRPFIPFLSRDFFLNQWIGRLTYRWQKERLARELAELEEAELERLAAE